MARAHHTRAIGKIRSWVSTAAAVALLPWIVYLAATLPEDYTAENWRGTWIGFDILLVAFLTATAVLGFLHSPLLTVVAFATGVLLVCDAWFDVMTAGPGDRLVSILSAAFGELPLAVILIGGSLRIVRLNIPPFSRRLSWHEFIRGTTRRR